MKIGQVITIDRVGYRIISIYPFNFQGNKRVSLTLEKINTRGAVYHTVLYENGVFSRVGSLGKLFNRSRKRR